MLDESDVPPAIHAEIFERYTFCLPEGELFLAYPVPGRNNETQPGRRAYNIVWYRPADPDKTLADLCTDASGRRHGTSIPPPLIRPEVMAAIKATARALVAPQVAEIFARARSRSSSRSSISNRRRPCSDGWRSWAMPRSWRGRMSAPASPRRRSMPPAWPRPSRQTTSQPASSATSASSSRSAAAWSRSDGEEGAYLSAQLKPREQRSEAELRRSIQDVLLAHNSRSENLRKALVASGAQAADTERTTENLVPSSVLR